MGRRTDFDGPLTDDEIAEGTLACLENGERLRQSALLVHRNGDAATAVFLASIRVEELVKAALLTQLAAGSISLTTFWKRFRSHGGKWGEFKVLTMDSVAGWSEEHRQQSLRQGAWSDAAFKELGLYVDYRADRGWMAPAQLPFAEQVRHILLLGDSLLTKVAPERLADSWDA